MGVSKNRGTPKSSILINRVFHYKPSILGYPYFGNTHIEVLTRHFGEFLFTVKMQSEAQQSTGSIVNLQCWGFYIYCMVLF